MNTRLAILMVAITLNIASFNVCAQCSTSTQPLGDGAKYSALTTKFEELQCEAGNEQFTNYYAIRFLITYKKDTRVPKVYSLQVFYGLMANGTDIPPRLLILKFLDGTTTTIRADSESPGKSGETFYLYYLDASDVEKVETKSLASLEMKDNRQNLSVTCVPYSSLLREAMQCAKNWLVRGY